ncbi:MAG: exodeoxyribonuclease VII small subunit [Ignavibacteriales bacterium]|nr:exodeoxyribonuclease VII small subunit [Ignavibacteriales bacterium]
MKKAKETIGTFEHSMKRLEEIVEKLETGSVSLDNAMELYEEGVKISKQCLDKLTQAELKLKRLSKDIDGNFELFDGNE